MSMNSKNQWVKSIRKALMGAVVGASILGGATDCSAHFPYRSWCWGSRWHGISYYSSVSTYWSLYYPRHFVHPYRPIVVRPAFGNPWCYTPIHYYAPPVYVVPIYRPSITQSSRMAVENWLDARDEYVSDAFESSEFQSVRPPMKLVSTQIELSEERDQPKSIVVAKPSIKTLTPTSSAWSDSATGLVDEMVLSGDMRSALRSCDAMTNNRQPMNKGVYLRHAILKLFTPDTETDVEKVLDLLNMSAAAGCELTPSDLDGSTLRDYLEPSRISLQKSLNQFSQNALNSKTDGATDMLIIATLLKLDGQSERARLFASEAFEKAAASDSFVWHSLLAAVSK